MSATRPIQAFAKFTQAHDLLIENYPDLQS